MATWPQSLPAPLLASYQFAPEATTIKTDMDSGPARVRRRFTTGVTQYQATWHFTGQQLAIFEAWFVHQAQSGASWFSMPQRNGQGNTNVNARFSTGTYTARALSDKLWEISGQLEVRDRPIMDAATLAGYL